MSSSAGRALDSKSKSRQFKSGLVHHINISIAWAYYFYLLCGRVGFEMLSKLHHKLHAFVPKRKAWLKFECSGTRGFNFYQMQPFWISLNYNELPSFWIWSPSFSNKQTDKQTNKTALDLQPLLKQVAQQSIYRVTGANSKEALFALCQWFGSKNQRCLSLGHELHCWVA